jgi:methyl-accepting chemotaxis protein
MLNSLSVNALLKCVIAILAAAVTVVLALGAWESWNRLATVNRIATVTEASAHLFTALHNLRLDRAQSARSINADAISDPATGPYRKPREDEMPALKSGLSVLERLTFPNRDAVVTELAARTKKLADLHQESDAAVRLPKAQRRPGLAQDFLSETTALLNLIEKVSSQMTRLVKLEDALIDQLMEVKQLAWVARGAAGDASLSVSNPLAGMPLPPDAFGLFMAHNAKVETAWQSIEELASGLPMPAPFKAALEKVKQEYFGREFTEQRTALVRQLTAGQKPDMTPDRWTPISVPRLAMLLGVADAALDFAKEHAAQQRSIATRSLWTQLGLLTGAVLLALGMMLVVSRRVTNPLRTIQQGMLKLAGGDLTAEVSFGDRKDEIGALAGSMQTFKDSMVETERLRAERRANEQRAGLQRKADMEKLADEFQSAVGSIVDAVSTASTELERAAGTLTKTAETTQQLSGVVASASEEASANVNSVASAAEEMSGSVHEIARQVQVSSKIAAEAVSQAEKTDARITELSNAASRIGDVVKLITAIAEQTNLLALNATIEAARAGEAGRGFAVVASEVKALAAQTAKATDEIGTQISSMQNATHESVAAIKEIGGTIGRIADIASAITIAVEQQGAATQEISRNVQQAAMGTAEVAANITDVSRGASETGSASSEVLGSAQSLARDSGRLRAEVEKFVNTVRAA